MVCPEYRLRLFLSVDLVGSTAFKAKHGAPSLDVERATPNPAWVDQIRHFYRDFPERVQRSYEKLDKPASLEKYNSAPQVWKTIGDEIVFCCRLSSREHLAACVRAFVGALEQYGQYLDSVGRLLDVKGYGWVAAFPSPNVTVVVSSGRQTAQPDPKVTPEFPDEAIEVKADAIPSQFDFLGKEIDAGFRTGRHCSADKLSLSLELSWLLTSLRENVHVRGVEFAYHGRQELKGVLNSRPYPIFSIDVERNENRREVRVRERIVSGVRETPSALHIHDFLQSFFADEDIEFPALRRLEADQLENELPANYREYQKNWTAIAEEIQRRWKNESDAADAEGDGHAQEDDAISDAAKHVLSRVRGDAIETPAEPQE